jgi:hypothetical protein
MFRLFCLSVLLWSKTKYWREWCKTMRKSCEIDLVSLREVE